MNEVNTSETSKYKEVRLGMRTQSRESLSGEQKPITTLRQK
jgi:hypothetical protein